jgi:hypothetical protein
MVLATVTSSCSFLISNTKFKSRNYDYEFYSFAKTIDFSKGKWLYTPTISSSFSKNDKASSEMLKEYLHSNLNDRFMEFRDLKDSNGKYMYPIEINFDNISENLNSLKTISEYDYIVTSKMFYLEDTDAIGIGKKHRNGKLKSSEYKSGCKGVLIIYDLKTGKEVFNMACTGYIKIEDSNTGINVYQASKSSSLKVMRKMIKKID